MKIVVIGPFSAGKSTLVSRVTRGSSFSIDKHGTTVSLDHGLAQFYGITLHIFGTPGLERFEILRRILSQGADGVIFVVDAVNPSSSEEARKLFMKLQEQLPNVPVAFAINKQDLDEARTAEEMLEEMDIPESKVAIVQPISAKTGEGVDHLVSLLVLTIISRYMEVLVAVRDGGMEGIPGIKALLKKPREENDLTTLVQWLAWRGLVVGNWPEQKFKLPKRVEEVIEIFEFIKQFNRPPTPELNESDARVR